MSRPQTSPDSSAAAASAAVDDDWDDALPLPDQSGDTQNMEADSDEDDDDGNDSNNDSAKSHYQDRQTSDATSSEKYWLRYQHRRVKR